MFESAPTATMLVGLDGSIMAANRSLRSAARLQRGRAPRQLRATISAPGRPRGGRRLDAEIARRRARPLPAGGALRDEGRARRSVTHLSVALVRDADGKPHFVIAMAEDVTERQQLEEQLRQSQKLEAIGRLAGGVAHDFNNMLTAISGYTAFALEHADEGSPLRSDLDEIRKATERAALLTRQLLAFSRKQVLQPELLDLNEIVVELETMLRPLIGEDIVADD